MPHYYYGLKSRLELVATTLPWEEHPRHPADTGYPARKKFSTVSPHPIIDLYRSSLKDHILSLLTNVSWSSVTVVRLGYSGTQGDPVTVLILIKFGTLEGTLASHLVQKFKSLLERLDLKDVHVEICQTYPQLGSDRNIPILRSPFTTSNGSPFAGSSIGVSSFAGSLGAMLKISSSSSTISAGLTCHHVCFPSSRSSPYESNGNNPCTLTCPSALDYSYTHKKLEDRIARMTLSVDDLLIDIAKNPTESKQTMLKLEEQELEWHRTELSKLQDHNIVSFAVSRTSGVRDSNGWIVDWALVTRDEIEDVSEFNTCPSIAGDKRAILDILRDTGCKIPGSLSSQIRPNICLDGDTEELFLKYGRTTSWTAGAMIEVPVMIEHCGTAGYAIGFISRTEQSFSAAGDSGSLIIDEKGRPVAQIFGGDEKDPGISPDMTLATPIGVVLDDIVDTLRKNGGNDKVTVKVVEPSMV